MGLGVFVDIWSMVPADGTYWRLKPLGGEGGGEVRIYIFDILTMGTRLQCAPADGTIGDSSRSAVREAAR